MSIELEYFLVLKELFQILGNEILKCRWRQGLEGHQVRWIEDWKPDWWLPELEFKSPKGESGLEKGYLTAYARRMVQLVLRAANCDETGVTHLKPGVSKKSLIARYRYNKLQIPQELLNNQNRDLLEEVPVNVEYDDDLNEGQDLRRDADEVEQEADEVEQEADEADIIDNGRIPATPENDDNLNDNLDDTLNNNDSIKTPSNPSLPSSPGTISTFNIQHSDIQSSSSSSSSSSSESSSGSSQNLTFHPPRHRTSTPNESLIDPPPTQSPSVNNESEFDYDIGTQNDRTSQLFENVRRRNSGNNNKYENWLITRLETTLSSKN